GDWSISTDKQAKALDEMFRASQATGVAVSELTKSVVQFGAPLREFGFSFEQALAVMGSFEREGVNMTTVMSGMRFALGEFAKAGKDPVESLNAAITAIKTAKDDTEALAISFQTFGKRGATDFRDVIRGGRLDVE